MAGDYRDPLVGRDLLIGVVFGAGMMVLQLLSYLVPNWFGKATPLLVTPGTTFLDPHMFFARFEAQVTAGLFIAFVCAFLLLLFLTLMRRELLALITVWIVLIVFSTLISQSTLVMVPIIAVTTALPIILMRRYGLLALTTAAVVVHLVIFFPMTTDITTWYATDFTIAMGICLLLGGYAAYTSLGGARVFSAKVFAD